MSTVIRVIGCGNPEAGDDAAGLIAVRRARERLADTPEVEIELAGTGARALDYVIGSDGVVVVDAVRTPGGARPPGTLVELDVGPEPLPAEVAASLSSHGLGLADVLGIGAALGSAPRVVFIGVEAEDVEVGHPLSPAVETAMPELVERVVADARELSHAGGGER